MIFIMKKKKFDEKGSHNTTINWNGIVAIHKKNLDDFEKIALGDMAVVLGGSIMKWKYKIIEKV